MSKFSLVRSGIIGDVRCSVLRKPTQSWRYRSANGLRLDLAGARLRISDFMASPSDHHPRRGVVGGRAAGLELIASLGDKLDKRGLVDVALMEPNRTHL